MYTNVNIEFQPAPNNVDMYSHIQIGTIIYIHGGGLYILSQVNGNQIALIGLVGGNRWYDPIDDKDVNTGTPWECNVELIEKMVGPDCKFSIVESLTIKN